MVKKQSKLSRKSKSKKSRSMKKSQRGGNSAANACTLQYSTGSPQYGGIGSSNLHNTNPQASLDLDNKFMGYGGPLPLGSSIVGGGSRKKNKKRMSKNKSNRKYKGGSNCGDEGVGTSRPKNETFKQYLENLDTNLSSFTGGSPIPNSKPNAIQKGAGYSSDPSSEFIGGQPVIRPYDDNSPPALINGSLIFGSPDQPVCGPAAIVGASLDLHLDHITHSNG